MTSFQPPASFSDSHCSADDHKSVVPLPAHIHYELLLQLLEQQTAPGFLQQQVTVAQQQELRSLIRTLRKAFSQQKNLEESCQRQRLQIDYRWSLND